VTQPRSTPLLALAPMHEVTDAAFRETVLACGAPDLMYTEFTSVDGLAHPAGRERVIRRYLQLGKSEPKTLAHFWGSDPEKFRAAAELARELGFAGIDINTGCPDRTVLKNGGGGALIRDFVRTAEIVAACLDGGGGLPVSVKTRLGYDRDIADDWLPHLAGTGVSLIAVHARTIVERSRVPAHWDRIRDFAPVMREKGVTFLGNGDAESREDAIARAEAAGCDGTMIGRGIFGNFWFFDPDRDTGSVPLGERLRTLSELADRFEARYGGFRSIATLRKHVKGLVQGFQGAARLREELMRASSAAEFRAVASAHAEADA